MNMDPFSKSERYQDDETERSMIKEIRYFISYLLGKKSEVSRLNQNDALMAKVVLDIHRKRAYSEFVLAPLRNILPLHPIDRGEALASMERRIKVLADTRHELSESKMIDRDFLNRHIPSVSAIKVVALDDGCFMSYEGNGRLGALQHVFGDKPDMKVEVELYHFHSKDREKILRRLDRVRRWNGLGAVDKTGNQGGGAHGKAIEST
jgi:hypothetical protein